jgi:hypothetical protein
MWPLPEREYVCLGAWLEERDLQRPLADRVVLAAEIRLGRAQVVPVGFRLHAEPFDGDELALDAEQTPDDALRLLVAPFAEVVVADDAVRVSAGDRRRASSENGGTQLGPRLRAAPC